MDITPTAAVPTTTKGFFQTGAGIAVAAVALFVAAWAVSKGWNKGKA
jgi:hypothetical protein